MNGAQRKGPRQTKTASDKLSPLRKVCRCAGLMGNMSLTFRGRLAPQPPAPSLLSWELTPEKISDDNDRKKGELSSGKEMVLEMSAGVLRLWSGWVRLLM